MSFQKCCAMQIRSIWASVNSPMSIQSYISVCDTCNHFIGLTQTPLKEANEFLESFELDPLIEGGDNNPKYFTSIKPL